MSYTLNLLFESEETSYLYACIILITTGFLIPGALWHNIKSNIDRIIDFIVFKK